MLKDVIKFHIDNQYYVKIKSIPNTIGCMVNFPPNLIKNKPEINKTYIINNDELEVYNQENEQKIESKIIKIQRYGIRLLILEDILLNTLERGISRNLIIIDNDNGNIFELLKIPLDTEELELEKILCVNFRKLLIGQAEEKIQPKIVECYQQIVKRFESGGL